MKFRDWIQNEEGTSTANVASFKMPLFASPMKTRWWVSDWEDEMATGKRRKRKSYRVPQIQEGSGYEYACAMFNLNPSDSAKVLSWSKKNIPERVLFTDGEKGREDDIHVTILYGIHEDNPEDVQKIVKNFKPSPIQFGEVSKFESDKYDVLKISVNGPILFQMNKALKRLPYTSTFNEYKPHCTLAYVEKGSCDHLLGNKDFQGWNVTLNSVTFSPSEGNRSLIQLG
jgi:hypothetical protein